MTDSRVVMIQAMFDMVPDGYYAVDKGDETPFKCIRVATRKVGKLKGIRTIETQHGEYFKIQCAFTHEGEWRTLPHVSFIEWLMLLVTDHQGAAIRYGREIGRCCRCNKDLTDARSRHYSIGPECEKHFPWVIEAVNLMHDGKSYEEMSQ